MDEGNGDGQKLPTLSIRWNAEAQGVGLEFNPLEFKSWDFILGILEMARHKAETAMKANQLRALQQQQQAAMQEAAIRNQILRP